MHFTFSMIRMLHVLLFSFLVSFSITAQEQPQSFLYGDALPDAPELAARGDFKVGLKY